jgi:hypothetical protein
MPINRRTLRADWRGPLTEREVAAKHFITARHLRRLWASEIAAGRLPNEPRPHFKQQSPKGSHSGKPPIVAAPPLSPQTGNNGMRLRKDNLAAGVDSIMTAIAALPDDVRQDAAETALAATICSSVAGGKPRPFTIFDLATLHVSAMIRRHQSGEHPLPVIPLIEGPGLSMTSAGRFAAEHSIGLSSGGHHRGQQ